MGIGGNRGSIRTQRKFCSMIFSSSLPTIMHVDLNSCFATIEQQANPCLRGRPVAVAAYTTGSGCILTASYEAKGMGVKTGMQVREGKQVCPGLIVLPSDPEKYRFINHKLRDLLGSYTPYLSVESIDEMVLNFRYTPKIKIPNVKCQIISNEYIKQQMENIAREIKKRIKNEIGEWLTVSIGISTNRYLAKVASGLHKPDGMDVITGENIEEIFSKLALIELCGIKMGNAGRLAAAGIRTTQELLAADALKLKQAFRSIVGLQWWARLHGYDPSTGSGQGDGVMDGEPKAASAESYGEPKQKSFGQSYALPKAYLSDSSEFLQIVTQLVVKMGRRLRAAGYVARGVGMMCAFADYGYWNLSHKGETQLFADSDFYGFVKRLLGKCPSKAVRLVAISCFELTQVKQLSLITSDRQRAQLMIAMDKIHNRYGELTVFPARMLGMERKVQDRIAFGKASL